MESPPQAVHDSLVNSLTPYKSHTLLSLVGTIIKQQAVEQVESPPQAVHDLLVNSLTPYRSHTLLSLVGTIIKQRADDIHHSTRSVNKQNVGEPALGLPLRQLM